MLDYKYDCFSGIFTTLRLCQGSIKQTSGSPHECAWGGFGYFFNPISCQNRNCQCIISEVDGSLCQANNQHLIVHGRWVTSYQCAIAASDVESIQIITSAQIPMDNTNDILAQHWRTHIFTLPCPFPYRFRDGVAQNIFVTIHNYIHKGIHYHSLPWHTKISRGRPSLSTMWPWRFWIIFWRGSFQQISGTIRPQGYIINNTSYISEENSWGKGIRKNVSWSSHPIS